MSTATVSLALRDSPLVADSTRDRIKAHARQIGYIYNRRAASLRTSRSGILGVVVHDIMNPFFAEILRSIETELDRNRQTFILSNHYDDVEKQRDFIETLLQLGADGVIMSPAINTPVEDIRAAEDNGLPAVLIARSVEGVDVPVFRGDDAFGTSLATNHLISLGHKRIVMIGGTDQTSTNGIARAGLTPGQDISVTGYDDLEEAAIATPALTTVWNGQREVGRRAARALLDKLNGIQVGSSQELIKPELHIRQSTGRPVERN